MTQPTPDDARRDEELARAQRRADTAEDEIRARGADARDNATGIGVAAGAGAGCLGLALWPLVIVALAAIAFAIFWFFGRAG